MSRKQGLALAAVGAVSVLAGGIAYAAHITPLDPATVPTGFFTAHTEIEEIPISALARAAAESGADVTIQHVRLGPGGDTGWHTHPGPGIVSVARGELTYVAAQGSRCVQTTYEAGSGFVDRGFGHVHKAIAGAEGADFYVVYVHPPGSQRHFTPTGGPAACAG